MHPYSIICFPFFLIYSHILLSRCLSCMDILVFFFFSISFPDKCLIFQLTYFKLLFIFLYLSLKITVFAKNILSLLFAIYAREITIFFFYFVVKLNCSCSRFFLNMKYSTTFSLLFVTLLVFSFGTSSHPSFQCFFLLLFCYMCIH
jgi:hypothetical protein